MTRKHDLSRIRDQLNRDGFPRLLMSLLVALTGGAGFVASYLLLEAGFEPMWVRYLLAITIAYGVFLALMYLWVNRRLSEILDVLDPSLLPQCPPSNASGKVVSGEGGQFSGGGASGTFEDGAAQGSLADSGPIDDAVGAVAEADEFAIPLAVVLLAAGLLLSSLFVIYSAPMLFAEVLLDAALSAGLYRRLRRIPRDHWLQTAIRRTIWPFALTAICVALAGWGMELYAPGAKSVGDVLLHAR